MKKAILLAAACILTVLAGCNTGREMIPAEVLQIPEFTKVYTAYNIWYSDAQKIDTLNVLKGKVIPFGTEVTFVKTTEKEITFKTSGDGKEYKLCFNASAQMITPEDYLKQAFTTKSADELSDGIRATVYEKIKRGIVEKGMTKAEVLLAFGHPAAFRTPSENDDTWVFWTDYLVSKRIIFRNGEVVEIVEL